MSFRSRLIGAWEIASWTAIKQDDENDVIYPMGRDVQGLIIYTPDGYISANLSRSGSPVYRNGPFQGTTEERAQVAQDTLAYSGLYYLEGIEGDGSQHLYHHMKVSIPRNWVETIQGRPARILEEDGEVFSCLQSQPTGDSKSTARIHHLKWRRAKDNSQLKKPLSS